MYLEACDKAKHKDMPTDNPQLGNPSETTALQTTIVGIGASAGSLIALKTFFTHMPLEPPLPLTFVLVQHLHPTHKSMLSELLKKHTSLNILQIKDQMAIAPDTLYIAPAMSLASIRSGKLHLKPFSDHLHDSQKCVDYFFCSLANDQKERCIGVILSGAGTDGTQGLQAIKNQGGMTMVQDPVTAEHGGMPSSAIATGLVDYILSPSEMPAQLIAHSTKSPKAMPPSSTKPCSDDKWVQKILALIYVQTGHDFSGYKKNTIKRRINRRLSLNAMTNYKNYFCYLQHDSLEVATLFKELLVGVTHFFRDPQAFETIEKHVLPAICAKKSKGDSVRIWVPGCSTGEEAYSLAILFREYQTRIQKPLKIQIFATDIDAHAIQSARKGVYPAHVANDIPPPLLQRYFTQLSEESFQIKSTIRDMLIFAEQSVIGDPPFSRLDLISCRNLFIYMDTTLQRKVINLFQYALNSCGFLFLGPSESIGDVMDRFTIIDRKWKVYQSRGNFTFEQAISTHIPPLIKGKSLELNQRAQQKPKIGQLVEDFLLKHHSPACVVVNAKGEILYIHGRTGKYLEPAQGEISFNIIDMIREGFKLQLVSALRKAVMKKETTQYHKLQVKGSPSTQLLNLTVTPLSSEHPQAIMIIFEDITLSLEERVQQVAATSETAADALIIADLEQALHNMEEYMQTVISELETTNVEMQSINEEFQSTNEELETSKEELESTNEELMMVNMELQQKIEALSDANNDMSNMLEGTGVGSIFLDVKLCIKRFTPLATQVISLIQSDLGRPLTHIATNLANYSNLVADAQEVLDTLIAKEIEVHSQTGKWYLMRILPYRTNNNAVEGAVINFIDITQQKHVQNRLAMIVRDSSDAIAMQDFQGRIMAWNPGAEQLYGWSEAEALTMNIKDTFPANQTEQALGIIKCLAQKKKLEPFYTQRVTKNGKMIDIWMNATVIVNRLGEPYAIATTERRSG